MTHLPCAYLIYNDDVRVVVLYRLQQDVRLLLSAGHHQAARIANAGVALVSITCSSNRMKGAGCINRTPILQAIADAHICALTCIHAHCSSSRYIWYAVCLTHGLRLLTHAEIAFTCHELTCCSRSPEPLAAFVQRLLSRSEVTSLVTRLVAAHLQS